MSNDPLFRRWRALSAEVDQGDRSFNDASEDLRRLVIDLREARMDEVEAIAASPTESHRAASVQRLTEYRLLGDHISDAWRRHDDLRRERAAVARELANHELAEAANAQTAALVKWTRWLAAATIVLAVSTVVLVVVTAAAR